MVLSKPIYACQIMNYFPYNKLEVGEIRLVELLPANANAKPECVLTRINLNNEPSPFIALSYCWGNPTATETISLSGHDFRVTTNLYSALQHLRHQTHSQLLWIDAICIFIIPTS